MAIIEILKELKERDLLSKLVKAGIIPIKVVNQMEMYYNVDAKRQTGTPKKQAVEDTAVQFRVCNATVYNAMSAMK